MLFPSVWFCDRWLRCEALCIVLRGKGAFVGKTQDCLEELNMVLFQSFVPPVPAAFACSFEWRISAVSACFFVVCSNPARINRFQKCLKLLQRRSPRQSAQVVTVGLVSLLVEATEVIAVIAALKKKRLIVNA